MSGGRRLNCSPGGLQVSTDHSAVHAGQSQISFRLDRAASPRAVSVQSTQCRLPLLKYKDSKPQTRIAHFMFYLPNAFELERTVLSVQRVPPRFPNPVTNHSFNGSSLILMYSRPIGPIAVTCVTYSPDIAQWKWGVSPGRTRTLPGGYAWSFSASNSSPMPR